MLMTYKFTRTGGVPTHDHGADAWVPNVWRSVAVPLVPCRNGIHACKRENLARWVADELYPIALDGEIVDADDKWVAERGCIGPRLEGWNTVTQRLFATDCAARVRHHAKDRRVTAAIVVARAFAFGLVSDTVRRARAIYAAANAAAATAYATYAAADAYAAADYAAYAAAYAAAATAGAAHYAAERAWQSDRILAYAHNAVDLDALRAATERDLPAALKAVGA